MSVPYERCIVQPAPHHTTLSEASNQGAPVGGASGVRGGTG